MTDPHAQTATASPAAPPRTSLAGLADELERHRWARLVGLALLLLVAFAFQGRRPLYDPDEGRYVATGLQALEHGTWLIPHLHPDHPHLTKPPLTTWALAAAIGVLGRSEAAARVPAALALVVSVLSTLGIGRRLTPGRGWLGAAVLATMLMPLCAANLVTPDPLLAAWEALGVYGFVVAWHAQGAGGRRLGMLLSWSAFGAAFLTKGPPGLLPLFGLVAFAAVRRGWRGLRLLAWPPALLAFAVVGAGWYVVACLRLPGLLSYFVGDEVVGRVATSMHGRNSAWYGGLAIYLPTFLAGTLPWTLALVRPLAAPRRALATLRERFRADDSVALLTLWLAVPLAIFLIARSRLPLYVLPLFPALALVVARRLGEKVLRARWGAAALVAWLLVALAPRWWPGIVPKYQDARALARAVEGLAGGPLDEIVFVEMPPRYALSFYVDTDVELVDLGDGEERRWDGRPFETLLEEMDTRHEGRRLFAARTKHLDRVRDVLATRGVELRADLVVQDVTLFWLDPPSGPPRPPGTR